ncbi:Crp/Fnr family transcriptional regulator [Flavobacterium sp.]|uniref:Crp/Fnr family transcriptional regulator n=1 Tax=Flavobacterium sp. TaxID=239 RepID=UPI004047EFBB
MTKEALNHYFHSLFPIEDAIVCQITKKFESFSLKKSELLLAENRINNKTYFLETGYVRSYTFDSKGNEITTNLFTAPCFVNDFLSFFKEQPTKENYETLTDCSFWQTDLETVQENFHSIPEFREFSRMLFVINYYKLHDRVLEMAKNTAEERYLNLLKNQPAIFQNVSLKIIASFLGITDTSLSRIRKKTALL